LVNTRDKAGGNLRRTDCGGEAYTLELAGNKRNPVDLAGKKRTPLVPLKARMNSFQRF